jgi:hypothetical protein
MPSTPLYITRNSGQDPESYLKFKKLRQDYIRESGGLEKASKGAFEWLTGLESVKNGYIREMKRGDVFEPGKLYFMDYVPIYKDRPYNTLPLIICLSDTNYPGARGFLQSVLRLFGVRPEKNHLLGINLNWLPEKVKENFVQGYVNLARGQLLTEMKGNKAMNVKRQSGLKITYEDLKNLNNDFFFSYAVRNYYKPGIRKAYEISYEYWYLMTTLQPNRNFKNISILQVYDGYRRYIINKSQQL